MKVEIDQSGRIDQTDRPTVLAMANGMQYSIRISATTKRECLQRLRQVWGGRNPKSLYVLFFATLLYFLLRKHITALSQLIVDTELPGHEARIKEHVVNLFRRRGIRVDPKIISFQRIGKQSPAHDLAIKVFRGTIPPDEEIGAEEILAEF